MSPDPKDSSSTKDAPVEGKDVSKKTDEVKAVKQPITLPQELRSNVLLIERAVSTFEPRFTAKVLRTLTTLRKKLQSQPDGMSVLKQVMEESYPKNDSTLSELLSLLPASSAAASNSMDVDPSSTPAPTSSDSTETPAHSNKPKKEVTEILPENDVYFRLLVILVLIDSKETEKANTFAHSTVAHLQTLSRRTLDSLSSKIYFYLHLTATQLSPPTSSSLRPLLLQAHRTATLRNDSDLQATLINLLLQNYFEHNLLDQADKLVSKSTFPESAGNAQLARYLYYLGRIRAVQLNYTEAHTHLQQAIRRAPPAHVAPGFIQTAYKFFIVVELLMGNIPDRSTFRLPVLKKALIPYFQIVQAVRIGDLSLFTQALNTHSATFSADRTQTLILRLRHTVIKTGIHTISLAYSKISLKDICLKLQLDNEEDAEYIVTKAIRDGVISGVGVDHEKGWMVGREGGDVYETGEPRKAFGQRVEFCLQLHNESVKAMRYPLNAHRRDLESGDAAREREKEIANEIAEGGDLDDDEMDF